MDFNLKGYADFLEAKNSRLLIIDYDEKHKLAAYFPIGNHYRKVMTWKTPQDAEKSIYKLYTNTYYHGSNFYLKQIDKLEERFKPEEFLNINSLKEACYQLNQKALKIHNIIQEGARNFGCQCRFLLIKHRCLRLLNFYESNFNNHIWKVTSKTPLIYLNDNGKEEKGFTYDFEFRQLNAKEDIRIKENMFGVSIECSLRDGFLEDYVLRQIGEHSLFNDYPINLIELTNLLKLMMLERNLVPDALDRYELKKALSLAQKDPSKLRNIIIEKYIEFTKAAGYQISKNSHLEEA